MPNTSEYATRAVSNGLRRSHSKAAGKKCVAMTFIVIFSFAVPLQHGSTPKVARCSNQQPWDNLGMDMDRDLLPWIMGGLSMASVALAVTIASSHRTAPASVQAPSQPAAQLLLPLPAENAPPPVPVPSAMPAAATVPPPTVEATPPTNQIWECTINGQRTFANHPCSGNSALREFGPLNTMQATPLLPPARTYEPQTGYPAETYYPDAQYPPDISYPIMVATPFIERRPNHWHPPHGHDHGTHPRSH
jgi:hypothetical protein